MPKTWQALALLRSSGTVRSAYVNELFLKGHSFMKQISLILLFKILAVLSFSQNTAMNEADILRAVDEVIEDRNKVFEIIFRNGFLVEQNPLLCMKIHQKLLIQARISKDKKNEAEALDVIGYCYRLLGNTVKSMEYAVEAVKLANETGDGVIIADCTISLAHILKEQSNYQEAIEMYKWVYKISQDSQSYNLQALALMELGDIYLNKNELDSALIYSEESYKLFIEANYFSYLSQIFGQLGMTHSRMGNNDQALHYFQMAIRESVGSGSPKFINQTYYYLASHFFNNHQLDSASHYAKLAIDSVENSGFSTLVLKPAKLLVDLYRGLNCDSSMKYLDVYLAANDSLFNTKKIQQIQLITFENEKALAQAEQEKKDALALDELEKQKLVRNGFIGGFLMLLFSSIIFLIQRNKIKLGKERSDELLLNILPEEVAEELKTKGSAEAKMLDEVTVLFTDFKGFTEISEKLSPKALIAEINECFSEFDRIMQKHGIEKIKTIGDAYMAAGGLPIPNTSHAQDVVNAALEIQYFMLEYAKRKKAAGELFFEIRIGVHTGPVVAGIVGVKKFAYDIWGDTVNIASRMESGGEIGKVNVSATTYNRVRHQYKCTPRGKVIAKGKGEIDMYFVESPV